MKYKIEIEVEPQIIKYQRGNWTWIIDYSGSEIEYRDVSLRSIQELINNKTLPITKIYNRVSQEFYFIYSGLEYIYKEGFWFRINEGEQVELHEEDIPVGLIEELKKLYN